MKPLETQLAELKEQLTGHFDNAAKEQKALGTVLEKTQSKITALQAQAIWKGLSPSARPA